ncbi:MAG TPA: hypothetical protein VFN11_06030 [Ktedonobacterales bacterium]|nr:hypothetical protein [Ktedonobacterales bacterium]
MKLSVRQHVTSPSQNDLRNVLMALPLLSLLLATLACGFGPGMARGRAVPPPVTHLPASQLQLDIQIFGQYDNASNVTVALLVREAAHTNVVSMPDKARLTCNGSNINPNFPSTSQPCPREPAGGVYRIVYTDEHGATSTVVVPVPVGALAIISPRDGSTVRIPANHQLTIRSAIPVAPPNSSVTLTNITAWCHATSNQPCNSVAYLAQYVPVATPSPGGPTATVFENRGPPTPTPGSGNPTATVFGPPTPVPGPTYTPSVPFVTVTRNGGMGVIVLSGDFSQYQTGSGMISLGIEADVTPDRGNFAGATVTMSGRVTANIIWTR